MISSGLYLFLGISVLLDAKRHTSSRTTSTGVAQRRLFVDFVVVCSSRASAVRNSGGNFCGAG
jgi:hypothetical protein